MTSARPRVLIFIVAYNAEATIRRVLDRIPALESYEVEVLVIDDASKDHTFAVADGVRRPGEYRHPLTVLQNPVNQGYGGNQKIGYHYAIVGRFDIVVLVHGDGQYAPEALPEMLAPIANGTADVVHGSRMLKPRDALKGGMPLYKFVGNKILTWYQNFALGGRLSEFHTGYKAYAVRALEQVPFDQNSNVFHFDTEIIIQMMRAGCRIVEVPIPTFYGDEVCHVNGMRYALDVARASTVAALMRYGLVYRRNFDVQSLRPDNKHYEPKLDFVSTHSQALSDVPPGSTVLDLGCGPGHLSPALRAKGCRVIGVDMFPPAQASAFDEFYVADLNVKPFPRPLHDVQVLLVLDVIEHLVSPEKLCDQRRRATQQNLDIKIIMSTANIGFIVPRLMLLLGQFNYNKRGILDLTHTRLFTFASMRRLMEEAGFVVESMRGIPAPAPLVVKGRWASKLIMRLQAAAIWMFPAVFSYQMYLVARPRPLLETLLKNANAHSAEKSALHEAAQV
jgi:glycosyltransferase involved in cell wall biosynthesis